MLAGSQYWEFKEEYFVKDIKKVQNNKYFPRIVANYPLEDLKGSDIPNGVIETMKEAYLEDSVFKNKFKMSKEDFYL